MAETATPAVQRSAQSHEHEGPGRSIAEASGNTSTQLSPVPRSGPASLISRSPNRPSSSVNSQSPGSLTIGAPGDRFEVEADRMADTITKGTPSPSVASATAGGTLQRTPSSAHPNQQSSLVNPHSNPSSLVNRQSNTLVPSVQAAFESEEAPQVQTKLIQREASTDTPTPTEGFAQQLSNSQGGGSPLPDGNRSQMEPHLGDLSGVRVHTDSQAADMSSSIGARAFTHGNDIYFNEGEYSPSTSEGQHLLAHEATHTVQQSGGIAAKMIQREAAPTPAAAPAVEQPLSLSFEDTAAPPPTPEAIQQAHEAGKVDTGVPNAEQQATSALPATAEPVPAAVPPQAAPGKQAHIEGEPEAEAKEKGKEGEKKAVTPDNPGNTTLNHLNAPASQMASNQSQVAGQVGTSMAANRQATQAAMPPLKADNTGKDKEEEGQQEGVMPDGKVAPMGDGVTGPEPPPATKGKHQNLGPAPEPGKNNKVLDKQKVAAFLSWFKSNFFGFSNTIKTKDPNVNTSAGERPKVPKEGKSDPQRADNQKKDSDAEVGKQTDEAKSAIDANPGKENIQPQDVTEEMPMTIGQEVAEISAERTQEMDDFLNLNLPPDVQALTDEGMQPHLDATLSAEKAKVSEAQQKQITDTEAEQTKAQEETAKLNEQATQQQKDAVAKNRAEVQATQDQGKKDAEGLMSDFDTQSSEKQRKAKEDIDKEVKSREKEADTELKKGEKKAADKKKQEEAKAAAKKREMEKESKSDSWWDRAVNAVKSAVKAVTSAIGSIFKALREAVTAIIDAAKDLALKAIEAARKFAVAALDALGSVLKGLVNTFIGSLFPGLAKRINEAIDATVNKAKEAVNAIADGLKKGVEALAEAAKAAVNKILEVMETAITAAIQIVGALVTGDFTEALKIAIQSACKIAGIDPKPVFDFIERAGDTLMTILKNPVQFVKNLAKGVGGGIDLFKKNIKQHLINGAIGWLGGAMSDVPLQLPDKWDLKGMFSLVMQILGLTYDRLRAKVVKQIGPQGEQIVGTIEKGAAIAGDVIGLLKEMYVQKSFMPLWTLIQSKWTSIKEQAMEKIRGVISLEVVKAGVKWLLSLLNPASAIVKAVLMIFDVTMFIIERKDQIVQMIQSIYGAIAPIARGETGAASKAVEGAMGRSVPVILGMLASVLGLGGIGKSVSKVLKTIHKQVDKVVDPVIKKIVEFAKKAVQTGKAGLKKIKDKILERIFGKKAKGKTKDGHSHTIYFNPNEKGTPKLKIASVEQNYSDFVQSIIAPAPQKAQMQTLATEIDTEMARYGRVPQPQRKAWADNVVEKINDLALLTWEHAESQVAPPHSVIHYGSTDSNGFGTSMKAEILSETFVRGEEAGKHSTMNWGWDEARSRKRVTNAGDLGPVYVRGHLLNNNLGGPAKNFNLTPITSDFNTNVHLDNAEKFVKKIVLGRFNGRDRNPRTPGVAKYYVIPKYNGHPSRDNIKTPYYQMMSKNTAQIKKLERANNNQPTPQSQELRDKNQVYQEVLELHNFEEEYLPTAFNVMWEELEYRPQPSGPNKWEPIAGTKHGPVDLPHPLPTNNAIYRPPS